MPGIWRTVDISTLKYTYFASHCFGQISVLATIFVFIFFFFFDIVSPLLR